MTSAYLGSLLVSGSLKMSSHEKVWDLAAIQITGNLALQLWGSKKLEGTEGYLDSQCHIYHRAVCRLAGWYLSSLR